MLHLIKNVGPFLVLNFTNASQFIVDLKTDSFFFNCKGLLLTDWH